MKLTAMESKQLDGPTTPYKKKRGDLSKPTEVDADYVATVKDLGEVTAAQMAKLKGVKHEAAFWRLNKLRQRGALKVDKGAAGIDHVFSLA